MAPAASATGIGCMVIVGAGQGGLQVAESLRAEGWTGPITLIGDETQPPYHRPPLSKALLNGEMTDAQLGIRGLDFFERQRITLLTGVRVSSIDRAVPAVRLDDGRSLSYDGLALATGARVRPLPVPGADLEGVFGLRTLDDAHRIGTALDTADRVVVIGGGFIGLEVAASARKRGRAVTVLEAADRLMARVVAPFVSDFYADLHRSHGVDVVLGAQVVALEGSGGKVAAVRTADGTVYPADAVVAGIGVIPNDDLAVAAGLACDRGIIVDDCARTHDPRIVAVGDCTVRVAEGAAPRRLESVQNAVEQGKAAAASLMGHERPFTAVPWFWSDQYDVKLQMVGLSAGHDRTVVRGSPVERRFSVFYFRDGALIAIDSVNRPPDHMTGRKLLDKRVPVTPEQVSDETVQLAALAR